MNNPWIRKAVLAVILTGGSLTVGCGSGPEGKYRDPTGGVTAEFKNGKAYLALGVMAVDGTYKIDGDKIIATGDFGPMIASPTVFTIIDSSTIQGPRDSLFPRLEKVK